MVHRKSKHAFHDIGGTAVNKKPDSDQAEDAPPAELPEMEEINQRLASFHASASSSRSNPPTTSKYLVDQIPGTNLPSTLSIGGQSREPVPEIPSERELAQAAVDSVSSGAFRTFQDACPPPADSQYTVIDQGVSGPNAFRISMYNVPVSAKLRESSQLPLALYVRPFAEPDVPLADFSSFNSEEMPPRCVRCRAYMNPSMRFIDGGVKFVCNLCLYVNHTPTEYYQPLTTDGRRIDWEERPELAYGTYEFEVSPPRESNKETGQGYDITNDMHGLPNAVNGGSAAKNVYGESMPPLRRVFCCECTRDAVQKGIVDAFVSSVREAVNLMAPEERVAIMLFDTNIYYFRKMGKTDRMQMLVMTPGDTAIVPPDVFYSPVEDLQALDSLLVSLPALYAAANTRVHCFGSALETALDAVNPGGRVSAFFCSLPSMQPSALTERDTTISGVSPVDAPVHHQLFAQTSRFYLKLAAKAKEQGSCIDVLSVPTTGYVDLANICCLAQQSGGKLLYYPRFSPARDKRRIIADVMDIVQTTQVRAASMRLRCSTGLQVNLLNEYASGKRADETREVYMDSDSTIVAELHHDAKLDPKLDAHFQAAVLYTTPDGSRRVRVLNLLAGVATKMKSLLKFVDIDVMLAVLVRQTMAQLDQHESVELRDAVRTKVMDVFGAARLHAGQGMPLSQLLMPTNLRGLIMMGLALTKSSSIGSRGYSVDARVFNAVLLSRAIPEQLSLALYPRIHDVVDYASTLTLKRGIRARFPDLLLGSQAHMIYDGQQLYLWLGTGVNHDIVEQLFGVRHLEKVSPWVDELPLLDNDLSRAAHHLCDALASRTGHSWRQLQIVRQGLDGAEYQVRQLMVEDTHGDSPQYTNFVMKVHEHAKVYKEHHGWF